MVVACSSFSYMMIMFILGEGVEERMTLHFKREKKGSWYPPFQITGTPLLSNLIIPNSQVIQSYPNWLAITWNRKQQRRSPCATSGFPAGVMMRSSCYSIIMFRSAPYALARLPPCYGTSYSTNCRSAVCGCLCAVMLHTIVIYFIP